MPATARVLSGLLVRSMLKLALTEGSKRPEGRILTRPAEPVMPPALEDPPPPPPAVPECCRRRRRRRRRWGYGWHQRAARRGTGAGTQQVRLSDGGVIAGGDGEIIIGDHGGDQLVHGEPRLAVLDGRQAGVGGEIRFRDNARKVRAPDQRERLGGRAVVGSDCAARVAAQERMPASLLGSRRAVLVLNGEMRRGLVGDRAVGGVVEIDAAAFKGKAHGLVDGDDGFGVGGERLHVGVLRGNEVALAQDDVVGDGEAGVELLLFGVERELGEAHGLMGCFYLRFALDEGDAT